MGVVSHVGDAVWFHSDGHGGVGSPSVGRMQIINGKRLGGATTDTTTYGPGPSGTGENVLRIHMAVAPARDNRIDLSHPALSTRMVPSSRRSNRISDIVSVSEQKLPSLTTCRSFGIPFAKTASS